MNRHMIGEAMKPRSRIGLLLFGILSLALWSGLAFADKRVALVVGNSAYARTVKLPNPENDAQDLAETLRTLNFDVILNVNLQKNDIDGVLEEFERKAQGADVALFFFAGHGLQYRGHNYLLPIDAELEDDVSLRYNTLAVDKVRDALDATTGVKIIILDACRDNPLAAKLSHRAANVYRSAEMTRSADVTQGLARLDRTEGMVVAYATQADQVAQDGDGRNSPFSSALIRRLREPNLEIATLFRRVAQDVFEQTGGRQRPELSISLLQDFFLNLQDDDSRAWRRLSPNATEAELKAFIAQFPNSPYAREAENRIYIFESVKQEYAHREEMRRAEARKEACSSESAQIERMVAARQKDGLARLKPQLVCSELAASIDQALAKLAAADEQACHDEGGKLRRIANSDIDALKKFAAGASCEAVRNRANETIANLEAGAAKDEAACRADSERFAAIKARQAQDAQAQSAFIELLSHLACGSLRPAIIAAIKDIDVQRASESLAREREQARLAALEEAKRKDAAESERQRRDETCRREAEQVGHLAAARQKNALLELKPRLSCSETIASADRVLTKLAASEELTCRDEHRALQRIGKDDLEALKKFVAAATCAAARDKAGDAVEKLAAEADRREVACRGEANQLANLKSQMGKEGNLPSELAEFQAHMTCDNLRSAVIAAIKDAEIERANAQLAQENEQARIAALEEAKRRAVVEAEKRKHDELCRGEAARIDSAGAAKRKDALEQLKPQLACSELAASIDKALAKLAAAEEQTCREERDVLRKIGKGDLEALKRFVAGANCEDIRKSAEETVASLEAQEAKREAACRSETDQFAAIDANRGQDPAPLAEFLKHLTCETLRPRVLKAIADIDAQRKSAELAHKREQARLAALEEEQRKAEAEAAKQRHAQTCAEESAQIDRLAGAKQTDGLAHLKPQLACPELGAQVDSALAKLSAAQEQACRDQSRALGKIGKDDLQALKKFAAGADCEAARKEASETIGRLDAKAASQQAACHSESDRFSAIKSRLADDAQAASELAELQSQMSCDSLRPVVAAMIKDVESAHRASQVRAAQSELRRIGCYAGDASGAFDDDTRSALKRYIKARGANGPVTVDDALLVELKGQPVIVCKQAPPAIAAPGREDRRIARPEPPIAPQVSHDSSSCAQILEQGQLVELTTSERRFLRDECK